MDSKNTVEVSERFTKNSLEKLAKNFQTVRERKSVVFSYIHWISATYILNPDV